MEEKVKETPQKMSYEELEQVAAQLSQQSQQLYARLQQADMTNMFKRLDYLFKVVENGPMFPNEFLDMCVAEIQETITPISEEAEEKE